MTLHNCETRDRIKKYVGKNPDATYRQIMKACKLSSLSQVSHHLDRLEYEDADAGALIAENKALRRENMKLKKQLAKASAILST